MLLRENIGKIVWKIIKAVILIGIIWYIYSVFSVGQFQETIAKLMANLQPKVQVEDQRLPPEEGARDVTYSWSYAGKKYEIIRTLHQSTFDFYRSQPTVFEYTGTEPPAGWQNEYFGMFLKEGNGDETISKFTADLVALGERNKLTNDQIVELAIAFVQAIPYDDNRAEKALSGDQAASPNYPYVTLYENKGICSDKSLLATALLRKLGYGASLFIYEAENHMAVGIKCPKENSTYQSGYCYAETTASGIKIGVIPSLDSNNRSIAASLISHFDDQSQQALRLTQLGQVQIFQKSDGKTYSGIINTLAMEKDIKDRENALISLNNDLKNQKSDLNRQKNSIDQLKNKMDKLKAKEDYDEYNDLVPKYNDLVSDYQDSIKEYNASVSLYNKKADEYNKLIKDG